MCRRLVGIVLKRKMHAVDQGQLRLGALSPKKTFGLSTVKKGLFRPNDERVAGTCGNTQSRRRTGQRSTVAYQPTADFLSLVLEGLTFPYGESI
jgi:hypothetical protein